MMFAAPPRAKAGAIFEFNRTDEKQQGCD